MQINLKMVTARRKPSSDVRPTIVNEHFWEIELSPSVFAFVPERHSPGVRGFLTRQGYRVYRYGVGQGFSNGEVLAIMDTDMDEVKESLSEHPFYESVVKLGKNSAVPPMSKI